MTPLLEIGDLRGGYGEVDILNGLDMTVGASEIVMVAGPNGSGKSTLTKAIIGILPRCSGRVTFDGTDLLKLRSESRVRAGVGYVPQVANVFPSLTVLENLLVVEAAADLKSGIAAMFETFPALAERRRQRAGSLSGGERQQLAFARALVAQPRFIILDEPTANVSVRLVAEILEQVKRMPSLGTAVLLVEQRAREALAISDRGYILNGGRVVAMGSATDLLADENLAARFLGRTH